MIYKLDSASGKELDISWGNFTKTEFFDKDSMIFRLSDIAKYFEQQKRNNRGPIYIYGFHGDSPEEIYKLCKDSFKKDGRLMRDLGEGIFQLGTYKYTIEINTLEDLHKLRDEFDARIVVDETTLTIYDDYLE